MDIKFEGKTQFSSVCPKVSAVKAPKMNFMELYTFLLRPCLRPRVIPGKGISQQSISFVT